MTNAHTSVRPRRALSRTLQTFSRFVAAALAAIAALSTNANAFVRNDSNWDPALLPIPYRVNVDSSPGPFSSAEALSSIQAAMNAWSGPSCTRWQTTFLGTTAITDAIPVDRQNIIAWRTTDWPPELGSSTSVIAMTLTAYNAFGTYDADMQLNAVGFTWSTDGTPGTMDLQSIVTHEGGHFLGLAHVPDSTSIMYPSSRSGVVRRDLAADDIDGVCTIYPAGSVPTPSGAPTCARYTSCGACGGFFGCGWCAASAACMAGTEIGPAGDTCAAGWTWQSSDCGRINVPCSTHGSCTTCFSTAGCGWCAGTATCTEGSASGPASGQCTSGWTTVAAACSAGPDPCAPHTTCGTCAPTGGCGWCGASATCFSGTSAGPRYTNCAGGWAWTPADCPTVPTIPLGGSCGGPGRCATGLTCETESSGQQLCTHTCSSDCDCPTTMHCGAVRDAGARMCVSGPVVPLADGSSGRSCGSSSRPGCLCTAPGAQTPGRSWALQALLVCAYMVLRAARGVQRRRNRRS